MGEIRDGEVRAIIGPPRRKVMFGINKLMEATKGITKIVDDTVVDQDKAIELKAQIITKMSELMMTGPAAKITKWTICGCVVIVVCTLTYSFLKYIAGAVSLSTFQDALRYATAEAEIIGILIGAYAAGTTVQRVMKK